MEWNLEHVDQDSNHKLEAEAKCLTVQEEGPTEADVSSLRSIEQRNWENLQQENAYWQEMLASTYMSRSYQLVSVDLTNMKLCKTQHQCTVACMTATVTSTWTHVVFLRLACTTKSSL